MKFQLIFIPITSLIVILVSTFFTYQVFSYYHPSKTQIDDNPSITLKLPDQDYVISRRDLENGDKELVIPTLDSTTPRISYNPNTGMLESIASPKDYVLDPVRLALQIKNYASSNADSIAPTYILRDRSATSLDVYNNNLTRTYLNPLNISLKDGSSQIDLALAPSFIRSILRPISTDTSHTLEIDKNLLLSYISSRLTPKQKKYFNPLVAYQNTKNAINLRFMGEDTPVVLGVDDGPSSGGELADRYLEIDLSQQKMYFFIGGSLYKEYRISTGADYPTPVGEYHILNKEPKAFSSIYNVWMPYWMGFKYAGDIGAYLGIHEIAYAVDAKGKPFYKHGYYIGEMYTGGCVAMEPKDSREVYNLSNVGMLIRIVP